MKLIFAIVNHDDANQVSRELSRAGFTSTRLATTGGFLMAGNVTLMVGVEEAQVEQAMEMIKKHSHSRRQMMPSPSEASGGLYPMLPVEVNVGGATIFVMDVDRFERA